MSLALLTMVPLFPLVAALLALAATWLADATTCRIAVLGDSLTASYGIALEEGFPAQLERALSGAGHDCEVLDAGVSEDELVTFKYEEQGVATLEDGIYVLEENLADAAFADKMVRYMADNGGLRTADDLADFKKSM